MTSKAIMWMLFTVIFLFLSVFNFLRARKKIAKFIPFKKLRKKKPKPEDSEFDVSLSSFLNNFNEFLDTYNRSISVQNILSSAGFFTAALVSFFSFLLEMNVL